MPSYLQIRRRHYRVTLQDWFRGLDKALIAIASALTFILTAIVIVLIVGMAQGLQRLADPAAPASLRLAVAGAWQAASLLLLRTLREATFMPRPRDWFATLPIGALRRLRADLLLSLASYSLLWLPVAWIFADPFGARAGAAGATLAAILELAALSLCVNITLLRGATRQALAAAAALLCFALVAGGGAAREILRLGLALAACGALWHSYLPARARAPAGARPGGFGERLVLGSGLVLGLLATELRANLLVRIGVIAATLAACLLVIGLRTNDTSTASELVFVAAVAGLALYTLPAMWRRTLLTKAAFLAGQPAFTRRMRVALYGVPIALYALALGIGWTFDRSGRAWLDALVPGVLFVLGVIGARLAWRPTTWLMPFASTIAVIVLAAMT